MHGADIHPGFQFRCRQENVTSTKGRPGARLRMGLPPDNIRTAESIILLETESGTFERLRNAPGKLIGGLEDDQRALLAA
jgi:hypothetical protein